MVEEEESISINRKGRKKTSSKWPSIIYAYTKNLHKKELKILEEEESIRKGRKRKIEKEIYLSQKLRSTKKKKEEITEETVTESVKSSSRKITIQIKSQLFTIGKKKRESQNRNRHARGESV